MMTEAIDLSRAKKVVFSPDCGVNTPEGVLMAQVKANIRRGLPQVFPHAPNPATALLVCGGPSLAETEKELVEEVWNGGKIVAVNGAYQWCIDHNLKPSAAIMLDARQFNARFLETPVPGCKYLLASQCHPEAFEHCKDRETYIWHACSGGDAEVDVLREYYFDRTHPITIGTTVGVRAISVLRMLGFTRIDIFGLDSCWLDGKHHSYAQSENDRDLSVDVWVVPDGHPEEAQKFSCAPWHMKQLEDVQKLIRERGDLFELNVRGRGLIAAMLRKAAKLQTESPQAMTAGAA